MKGGRRHCRLSVKHPKGQKFERSECFFRAQPLCCCVRLSRLRCPVALAIVQQVGVFVDPNTFQRMDRAYPNIRTYVCDKRVSCSTDVGGY